MSQFRQDFLQFALRQNVLKFGEFTTKAGRQSPYFFNAGLFNDGAATLGPLLTAADASSCAPDRRRSLPDRDVRAAGVLSARPFSSGRIGL